MANLEARLENEADKKGLHGKERQRYIGGTIHNIKERKHAFNRRKRNNNVSDEELRSYLTNSYDEKIKDIDKQLSQTYHTKTKRKAFERDKRAMERAKKNALTQTTIDEQKRIIKNNLEVHDKQADDLLKTARDIYRQARGKEKEQAKKTYENVKKAYDQYYAEDTFTRARHDIMAYTHMKAMHRFT